MACGYAGKGVGLANSKTELGISTSTANTHIRHIYQKLSIHTKQELFDLFCE
ncbi:MAG: hypothetical protein IKE43_08010 [Coriobacteriales bacterium]|nr:hypothetical protein [Coriobacteriales bacterium]